MRSAYDVIIRPIITEKSMSGVDDRKYVFEVPVDAGKIEIRQAVEKAFDVKVKSVNTVRMHPKRKRLGARRPGLTKQWKKAYVQLTEDSRTIEFFDSMI